MPDILKIMITPVPLIFGALIGTWRFQLDPRRDVGFRRAIATHAVVFTLGFLILMGLHEWLYHLAGMADGQNDWRKYAPGALALRVLFVGLVYPLAEELFFRGFLLGLITRKAGAFAGLVVTALLFTALHGMAAVSGLVHCCCSPMARTSRSHGFAAGRCCYPWPSTSSATASPSSCGFIDRRCGGRGAATCRGSARWIGAHPRCAGIAA